MPSTRGRGGFDQAMTEASITPIPMTPAGDSGRQAEPTANASCIAASPPARFQRSFVLADYAEAVPPG